MVLESGSRFAGRYELQKQLGRGGFSEVWLALDTLSGVPVALKVYAPYGGLDENGNQLFSKEFSLVFNINQTNLLKPTYYDTCEGSPYLILPFCSNGSAAALIGQCDEETIINILHDVASGLAYLHAQDPPIIHQDIKPDNILISDQGDYVITDFGISTKIRSTLRKSITAQEGSGGTFAYMGPERFSKHPVPVKSSDIWSVGAMAFELLEGYPPFDNMGGVMQKNGAELPEIQAPVSEELKEVIYRCMAKEPWDRPTASTLVQWANTLKEGLVPDLGVSGQEEAAPEPAAPESKKTVRVTGAMLENMEKQAVEAVPGNRKTVRLADATSGSQKTVLMNRAKGTVVSADAPPTPSMEPYPPQEPPSRKSNKGLIIGIIAAAVLLGGAGAWLAISSAQKKRHEENVNRARNEVIAKYQQNHLAFTMDLNDKVERVTFDTLDVREVLNVPVQTFGKMLADYKDELSPSSSSSRRQRALKELEDLAEKYEKAYPEGASEIYALLAIIYSNKNFTSDDNYDTEYGTLLSNMGISTAITNNPQNANSFAKRAVELNPDNYKAHYELMCDYLGGVRRIPDTEREMDNAKNHLYMGLKAALKNRDDKYVTMFRFRGQKQNMQEVVEQVEGDLSQE